MTLADIRPSKPAPISANALILTGIFAALTFALARMDAPPGVLTFAFVAVGWILSVVVHEFAHAETPWPLPTSTAPSPPRSAPTP